jgi:LmbE family N-acetylglucosaminyl deacetylase
VSRAVRVGITLAILATALPLRAGRSEAAARELDMDAATLAHALDRIAGTGRVLYVAAHPDDENTRLLAYLANERHVTPAYLSMTRGGGGQNLIGREQDELLDVIRTEELLAARRLDGASQRFTRMRDFGFSKSAEETFSIWGHEDALADVVWVVRSFQPDVIVTRFDEKPPNHGHHTASAILAREAFAAAADPARFPEQLALGVEPWRAERLLLNVPTWTDKPPPEGALALDVGGYDPRLGLSWGELAARSRSQHKSQGFGVPGERGEILERFVAIEGSRPERDVLEGIDLSWSRFGPKGAALDEALGEAGRTLDRDRPESALPALLRAHDLLKDLPDGPRVRDARIELDRILAGAAGLFIRATASRPAAVPGGEVPVRVEVVLRRPARVHLSSLSFPGLPPVQENVELPLEKKKEITRDVPIPSDARISSPYWLASSPAKGHQRVADPRLVGEPLGPPPLAVAAKLAIGDREIRVEVPVVISWTDRVHGERIRTFLVVPPATATPARAAVLFPNGERRRVAVRIRAGEDAFRGDAVLRVPDGWKVEPERIPVELAKAGDEVTVGFDVTPQDGAGPALAEPAIESGGRSWSFREDVIDYSHIPLQVVLQPASVRLVPLTVALPEGRIGYVPGSGDTIAEDLAHVGMEVETISDERLRSGDLSRYAAIVVGIRAYNASPVVRTAHARLMDYVAAGGTVVVQYNTTNPREPLTAPIGPFPLTVGRGRITDETAAMEPSKKDHPILKRPNPITAADFESWVQERGLYYAESWDDRYEPILRATDPGEAPLDGGLLVARHGKGRYVYTGLAFFRQLPAGVPGAYRLFLNLLASRGE